MLSIGKLVAGGADYYLDTVARGAEEYYLGAGEIPGRWVGAGSAHLGLSGDVTGTALRRVLDGADPSGRPLLARQGPKRMPGFDCTFNAPKSVSLLFALGSDEVRRQVSEAHDAAVEAALTVLEAEACRVRRGRGGAQVVAADGFVAAAFRHRTSRSGDPHLHTHAVVANLARSGSDGRWSTLDGRQLYAWSRTAGFLYEAHLRAELTGRLGVEWGPVHNGIADVDGISRRVIDHFSQRRRDIVERMAQVGSRGGHAAQVATYATRTAKDTTVPYPVLRDSWVRRAERLGLDEAALDGICDGTDRQRPSRAGIEPERLYWRLDAPTGLTAHRATFDRPDVIRQICERLQAGASVDDVIVLADDYLGSRHVVPLADSGSDRIRRTDGRSAPISTDQQRWTTPDMLDTERRLILMATGRAASDAGLADAEAVEVAIASGRLGDEQEVMVRRICGSGNGVDVVPGIAGSGKTHALAAAHQAWTASGRTVVGVALSAQAARQLEAGSAIPSHTIARFLRSLDRPDDSGLGPDHVVVVDEAAMVGTRALVDLVGRVHRANAKIVLIGDACQLPEIEAGGAFAGLQRRTRPAGLTRNRRQHEPWERQALADLRLGHAAEAVAAYEAHGRIHHQVDPDRTRDELVEQWWDSRIEGRDVLMLAAHHDNVRDLNARARRRMLNAGELTGEPVELGGWEFAVGDDVLGLRNDYRAGILNGTRGTIVAIDRRAAELRIEVTDRDAIRLPFAYAEAGHLAHGYAMTIHKAQGATCDHALVLVDETMAREAIYTAMSRGRQRNDLYLTVNGARGEIAHAAEVPQDPEAVLLAGIERSSAQEMAIGREVI